MRKIKVKISEYESISRRLLVYQEPRNHRLDKVNIARPTTFLDIPIYAEY